MVKVQAIMAVLSALAAGSISFAHAQEIEIPTRVALRVLVGEAANQGLKGMICVGEVLRRRGGSPKGFVGYNSGLIDREPKSTIELALEAWRQSAFTNYTKGADHFINPKGKEPYWVKHFEHVYTYKDHKFFKAVKPKKRLKGAKS